MKVLYFHQHFTTPKNGGGIRSYEFAKCLINKGHQVSMVCGGKPIEGLSASKDPEVKRGNVDGIDVIQINIPYSNSDGLVKRAWKFVKFAWKGISFAKNEEYDLLFATSTPLTAGIPGIYAKVFKKKPFIFEVRDLWPELPKALGMKNPFFIGGMSLIEYLSYHKADGCIGLSPGICDGIKRRCQRGKPIVMIPNGCDVDIFNRDCRENLKLEGIGPEDTVALFTGAHGIANGLHSILDAAAVLKSRNRNDIKFAFIGEGKMKPELIARANSEGLDNCLFYNPVSKNELNKIMSCANIGIMCLKNVPAFYYGTSPNKFFDYISSSLPVINNYPGWLADMIIENKCGIVTEPDNAEAFADAMEYMSLHQPECKEMGSRGRMLAEREFNRQRLGELFVDFIEKTLILNA